MDIIAYIALIFGFIGTVNIFTALVKAKFRLPEIDDLQTTGTVTRIVVVTALFCVLILLLSAPLLAGFLPERAYVKYVDGQVLKLETETEVIHRKTCQARFYWKRTASLVSHLDHTRVLESPSCNSISESDINVVNKELSILKNSLNIE